MKKNNLLYVLFGLAIFGYGIFTYQSISNQIIDYNAYNSKETKVTINKPNNINEDGSFVLSNSTIKKDFEKKDGVRTYNWYADPYCPDCIRIHEATHEYIEQSLKDGSIQIMFHPLNFTSHKSGEYSLTISAWVSGLADVSQDSEKVYKFMTKIWNNATKEDLKNLTDVSLEEKIVNIANEIGFSKKEVKQVSDNLKGYEFAINQASVNIRRMDKFKELSPKKDKSFFVPFIYGENGKALDGESEKIDSDILGPLKGLVPCSETCH